MEIQELWKEARKLGYSAKEHYKNGSLEEAISLKQKEIKLLEEYFNCLSPENEEVGQICSWLGQAYSTLAAYVHEHGENNIHYLEKARERFKKAFDTYNLPAYSYSTYLWVLELLEKGKSLPERLPYVNEKVLLLIKASIENRNIKCCGSQEPAKKLLRNALHQQQQIQEQLNYIKVHKNT